MTERLQPIHEDRGFGPDSPGSVFDTSSHQQHNVTVVHGIHSEDLPVGNMTIAEIRSRFGDRFDIDPRSQAVVDGIEADEKALVKAGQHLIFMRKAGIKGHEFFTKSG